MTDSAATIRVEPTLDPAPGSAPRADASEKLKAAVESAPVLAATPSTTAVSGSERPIVAGGNVHDQLARIEDKAARIEDKYARSEALLNRVEDKVETATTRMNESARQADLAALRTEVRALSDRLRRAPGYVTLLVVAILTALLTVALMLAAQKYGIPGLIAPRAG